MSPIKCRWCFTVLYIERLRLMPHVINPVPAPHNPATIAWVEILIRAWLHADEASERAWSEAIRARKEAIDALRTIGGEHSQDGWHYCVMPSVTCSGNNPSIERRPYGQVEARRPVIPSHLLIQGDAIVSGDR